jgi:hypothetical protein
MRKRKGETNVTDQQPLKLVVAYDRNPNEYSIVAHNRTPEEAEEHVAQWSPHLRPGCTFMVFAQARRHRTEEPTDCRACREIVARSAQFEPQPKFIRRSE